jgi:multidrug efflux pump subunit AcrA (membrane-fusion protein)
MDRTDIGGCIHLGSKREIDNEESRKKMQKKPIVHGIIVFLIMAVAAAGWIFRSRFIPEKQSIPQEKTLTASGVIQADQISVSSEFGGLITNIPVDEGEAVKPGDIVVQLDTELIDGEIAVMEAVVAAAEAGLVQAEAGARSGQIAIAEAQLLYARTALTTVQSSISDTLVLIDTPQDIDLQIAVLRKQIDAAKEQHAQAVANKDAVEIAKNKYDAVYAEFNGGGRLRFDIAQGKIVDLVKDNLPDPLVDQLPDSFGENIPPLDRTITYNEYELQLSGDSYQLSMWKDISFPLEATLLPNTWWQAWVGVNAATARTEGLQAQLNQLYIQRENPQAMQALLDESTALEAQLSAQVSMAETQVEALKTGLTAEEINAISAKVDQARAGLQALQSKRDMLVLTSPISGTVTHILHQEGEVSSQGAGLVTIADLAHLTLTVYVPETMLGDVWLDQVVDVQVSSFPGKTFQGYISYISDSAEFTPRNVATVDERQNLVFAVDIHISNRGRTLKPGMPADVVFTSQSRIKQ